MATQATYSFVGISTFNRSTKLRFANADRTALMAAQGHTNMEFVALTTPLQKLDAAYLMKEIPEFQTPEYLAVIEEFIDKNTPKPARSRGRPRKVVDEVPVYDETGEHVIVTGEEVAVA